MDVLTAGEFRQAKNDTVPEIAAWRKTLEYSVAYLQYPRVSLERGRRRIAFVLEWRLFYGLAKSWHSFCNLDFHA
jgi:hypothetical protein